MHRHPTARHLLPLLAACVTLPATAQVSNLSANASQQLESGTATAFSSTLPNDPVDVLDFSNATFSTSGIHTYGSSTGNFGSRSSGTGVYDVSGVFNITETISNNTASAVAAVMNFNITPGLLNNAITSALTGTDFVSASIAFNIQVDALSVWHSSATLSTTSSGTTFSSSGTNLYTLQSPTYYAINGGAYSVALGTIAANSSISLSYTLSTWASGQNQGGTPVTVPEQVIDVPAQFVDFCKQPPNQGAQPTGLTMIDGGGPCLGTLEGGHFVIPAHQEPGTTPAGSHASSGDPFTIDSSGHVQYMPPFIGSVDPTGFNVSTVPEPGGVALMLAGLGLLGWRARRQ